MADVMMPQMGESITEGTITKWLKRIGEKVQRDEPLLEISTDKVDAEIPAPASGVLTEIRYQPGATVPINTVVAVLSTETDARPALPSTRPSAPLPPEPIFIPPDLTSATPAAPPPLGPVSAVTDRRAPAATMAPAAPTAAMPLDATEPTLVSALPQPPPNLPRFPSPVSTKRSVASPGPAAPATDPSVSFAKSPASFADAAPPPATIPPRSTEPTEEELRQKRSSPVVRKIAAEHSIDIGQIAGSGISGRVTKQDILDHLDAHRDATASTPTTTPVTAVPSEPLPTPVPAPKGGERVEVVPMSPIRKKTAEHMVLSKRISAHVNTVFEVDMTRVEQLRDKYRPSYLDRSRVRLTYLPFILKATIDALKAFPVLNASVEGDAIVYKKDINIGVAVALDWGLIVPVIRNADEKNVLGLARTVNDLADRARLKKLRVEEVQGGTFTITNPGVFGSLFGTPIINQPQVAILGIGTIEKRPIVRDDAIAIRTLAYFALTFDHRIVDGSEADRFMAHIKKGLQEFDESAL